MSVLMMVLCFVMILFLFFFSVGAMCDPVHAIETIHSLYSLIRASGNVL